MTKIQLGQRNDTETLARQFSENQRVQVPEFLSPHSAELIYDILYQQKDWNLAWNLDGEHKDMDYQGVMNWTEEQRKKLDEIIHLQASREFQYRFASIPIYDIYQQNRMPGHVFNQICEFVNSPPMIKLAQKLTACPEIKFADIQATRYTAGHFLTEHNDEVTGKNRVAAYVINLTPHWRPDWGGALIFPDAKSGAQAWFPQFNVLNLFKVPQKHAVTVVSPFAPAPRYALTGWFRSG